MIMLMEEALHEGEEEEGERMSRVDAFRESKDGSKMERWNLTANDNGTNFYQFSDHNDNILQEMEDRGLQFRGHKLSCENNV